MKQDLSFVAPLIACVFLASACSSPDGSDPVDTDGGSVTDGGAPDSGDGGTPDSGPSCTEVLPSGLVFGNLTLANERSTSILASAFTSTPGGRLMVPYAESFGRYVGRVWTGSAWVTAPISPAGATVGYGSLFGATGEKFMAVISQAFPGDTSGLTRAYSETSPGVFGAGVTTPIANAFPSTTFAYLEDSHRTGFLSTAFGASSPVYYSERSDGAPTWHNEVVANTPASGIYQLPVIAGYKSNGTAFAIISRNSTTTTSFVLYRRAGVSWSEVKTLYTTSSAKVYNTSALQAAGRSVYLGWEEYASLTGSVKAMSMDIETETLSAVSTILPPQPVTTQNTIYMTFGATQDGKRVAYAVHDRTTSQVGLGYSDDDGATFSAMKPYHPELAHDGVAVPFFSSCGKPMLMHRTFEVGASATARYNIDPLSPANDLGIL